MNLKQASPLAEVVAANHYCPESLLESLAAPSNDYWIRMAATENWARFTKDPEWVKLKAESEANGAFVEKHDITFMTLTDFSPAV